ncbi:MAG: hypothetical protein MRQ09_04450 [Candidatus Midichloria sp.]|nr:hypothetical protein [Candidatus Midichloria sp.]
MYSSITASGKLKIFSYHHLISSRKDDKKGSEKESDEHIGNMKKDLTVISKDINNIIIADDDRTYILGDQYPFIGLSYPASADFAYALPKKDTIKDMH